MRTKPKKTVIQLLFLCITLLLCNKKIFSQGETFSSQVLNTLPSGTANDYRLAHPFEIIYGPDDYLYITEKIGRVVRVNTTTGIRQIILDIQSKVALGISRSGSSPYAASSIEQNGMMGMALHPNFNLGTSQDSVYIAYTHTTGSVRISKFNFNSNRSGNGLVAEYFNNTAFTVPALVHQVDATVDNSWAGSPVGAIGNDNFSVRWSGQVEAPVTGNYTFSTVSDDGVRLWINDTMRINNWTDHASTTDNSSAIYLTAGQKYNIRLEYYEATGGAEVRLRWSYPGQSTQVIPNTYLYQSSTYLTGESILLQGMPSNNDHSTGRLIIGGDNKLYYSCGDLGNNQFGNRCAAIRSQDLPSSAEIIAANYTDYSGKILRINLDGSIPADNPTLSSVQSHVYTLGHRNPQGMVWQKTASAGYTYPSPVSGGKLFSSEHGPRTDDEINIITSGKNYGWPYIAGFNDNTNYQYINWSSAPATCGSTSYTENAIPSGATVLNESDAPGTVTSNFQPPIGAVFTACNTAPNCNAGGTNWMQYPTIAPASIDYYHVNGGAGVPNWYPSLLVPTLRRGTLYRIKLTPTEDGFLSDTIPYFFSTNRYRDIAINPGGNKIYIVTDSIGSTSGPSGSGTSTLSNRGDILVYTYTGGGLNYRQPDSVARNIRNNIIRIYPNPTTEIINIQFDKALHKPIRYQLYNAAGVMVTEGTTNKDQVSIDVKTQPKGIYILKIYNGYNVEVRMEKILIQ